MYQIFGEDVTTQSREMELVGHKVLVTRIFEKDTERVLYYRFKRLDAEDSAAIDINGSLFDCGAFFVPVPHGRQSPATFSSYVEDYLIEAMYIAYCVGANIIKLPPMTLDSDRNR